MTSLRERALFFVVIIAFVLTPLEAATRTWAGGSGVWSNGANWVGGVAPSPGDDLVFPVETPSTLNSVATNDYPDGTPFNSLTLNATSFDSPELVGNRIVLGAGGITASAPAFNGGTIFVGLPITLGVPQTWTITSRNVSIGGSIHLNGHTLTIVEGANTGLVRLLSVIEGSGSIAINGVDVDVYPPVDAAIPTDTAAPLSFTDAEITFFRNWPAPVTGNGGRLILERPVPHGATLIPAGSLTLGPLSLTGVTIEREDWRVFTGDLSLTGGQFPVAIRFDDPSRPFPADRVVVTGTVTLANPVLNVTMTPLPGFADIAPGTTFTIIENDGTDAVTGTFAGLPEGAAVISQPTNSNAAPQHFTISYQGGTGNDVVLTAQPRPAAATLVVTNLNDSGTGSLRQAVLNSNSLPGANTIVFLQGLTGTITLTSGEMAILDSVRIQGPGSSIITVSGNNASRIFSGEATRIALDGLTLTAGLADAGGALDLAARTLALYDVRVTNSVATTGNGGGLRFQDRYNPDERTLLVIANSVIDGNEAMNGSGGGLSANTQNLNLDQTTISNNDAGIHGGGVDATVYTGGLGQTLLITGSTISGNRAGLTAPGHGGGLHVLTSNGIERWVTATVNASRITGNSTSTGNGGGLYTRGDVAATPWTFDHSEITENSALSGGGIYNDDNQAPAGFGAASTFIDQTTVANNTATIEAGGLFMPYSSNLRGATVASNTAATGGGVVYTTGQFSSLHDVEHSIVADNTAALNPDIHTTNGATVNVEYSLIETPGTAALTIGAGVITGVDPLLGPLQFDPNSPTRTKSPLSGSPAIDAGRTSLTPQDPTTDQRFYPRLFGPAMDMGAVEVQPPPGPSQLTISKVASPSPAFVGEFVTYTVTVMNVGTGAAGFVEVMDTLPTGATLVPGVCSGTSTIVCRLGTIPAGQQRSVNYAVHFEQPGTYTNLARVTSTPADSNSADNIDWATVIVQYPPAPQPFDLSVTAEVFPTAAAAGDDVTFTFTIANAGPGDATFVSLSAPVPPGAMFVSAISSVGTCTLFGDRVGCDLGTLAGGAEVTVGITVRITGDDPVTMTASVTAGGATGDAPEVTVQNNSAGATVGNSSHAEDIPTLQTWMLLLLIAALAAAGVISRA